MYSVIKVKLDTNLFLYQQGWYRDDQLVPSQGGVFLFAINDAECGDDGDNQF